MFDQQFACAEQAEQREQRSELQSMCFLFPPVLDPENVRLHCDLMGRYRKSIMNGGLNGCSWVY